jgi:hypothetical protein
MGTFRMKEGLGFKAKGGQLERRQERRGVDGIHG